MPAVPPPGSSVSISRAAASIERVTWEGTERNVLSNSLSSSGEPIGAVSTRCRSFLRSTFRIRRGPVVRIVLQLAYRRINEGLRPPFQALPRLAQNGKLECICGEAGKPRKNGAKKERGNNELGPPRAFLLDPPKWRLPWTTLNRR